MAFITQSWRLGIFRSLTNPAKNNQKLEKVFTQGLKYPGWVNSFFKVIDGSQLHGWDSLEIEYDDTKPLHVGFDHVGHENLYFPKFIKNLEFAETIMRRYEFTAFQLKRFVLNKGFSSQTVIEITQTKQQEIENGLETKFEVYKVYKKDSSGKVYVAWCSLDVPATTWLKAPEPLWMGRKETVTETVMEPQAMGMDEIGMPIIVPVPTTVKKVVPIHESTYPIKIKLYNITEKDEITSNFGRAFEDLPAQDAQTALWSSFINGSVRASNVYGSPKTSNGSGAPIKQLEIQLEHGSLYNEPIDFWHTDSPPMSMIDAAARLDTVKQGETGQIAYATLTRKDTEKTATELNMAQDQSKLLSTVQITLLADWMREVLQHTWLIVQNLAVNQEITLPGITSEDVSDFYDVESSGSTDVVEREQKLQRRGQMWSLIQNTPIAQIFLEDILRESLPDDADRYVAALQAGDPKVKMIQNLMSVMQELILDPATGQIKPEFKAQEAMFAQLAEQATAVQAPMK